MRRLMSMTIGLMISAHVTAATGWTGQRTILGLEFSSVAVEVRLSGSGGACTSFVEGGIQKTWTKIDVGQANEKQLVAALMLAYASGRTIDVHCSSAADWTGLDRIILSP
jgi:hypothetical protein